MKRNVRLKALLSKGYFPKELPPPFTSAVFASQYLLLDKLWASNSFQSDYERYSFPRVDWARRQLSVLNPVSYFYLSQGITDNWKELSQHIRKSKSAIVKPLFDANSTRAIRATNFQGLDEEKLELFARYNHIIETDISRFYSTIYTHSIPWALYGKDWCKLNLSGALTAKFGHRLDKLTRHCQSNQSIGLPIGPDSSRIISEVLLVAIEERTRHSVKFNAKNSVRHIDDSYFAADTESQAREMFARFSEGLRYFELEPNLTKTRQLTPNDNHSPEWVAEMRSIRISFSGSNQRQSLERLFIRAFEIQKQFGEENVLLYAVSKSEGTTISKVNWRLYERFLIKSARASSASLPLVAEILINYNAENYAVDKDLIKDLICDLIEDNCRAAHHGEVAWALFLAKALGIALPRKSARPVSNLESSVCALLALDLRSKGLIPSNAIDTTIWQQYLNSNGLASRMWLLAYEAPKKNWLRPSNTNYITNDVHFSELWQKSVYFYDDQKNVPRRKSSVMKRFDRLKAQSAISRMIEYSHGDIYL